MINRTLLTENEADFRYLYKLQASGRTNMFGAGVYLQNERGLDRIKAREVLNEWMNNYDEIGKELGDKTLMKQVGWKMLEKNPSDAYDAGTETGDNSLLSKAGWKLLKENDQIKAYHAGKVSGDNTLVKAAFDSLISIYQLEGLKEIVYNLFEPNLVKSNLIKSALTKIKDYSALGIPKTEGSNIPIC